MSESITEEKYAVESGYWTLWRYNPDRLKENLSPFILDSPSPTMSYKKFVLGENRYKQLHKKDEELAEKLFDEAREKAMETYYLIKELSEKKYN